MSVCPNVYDASAPSSSTGVSAATVLRCPTQMAHTDMKPTNHSASRSVSQMMNPGMSHTTKSQKLIALRCLADVL